MSNSEPTEEWRIIMRDMTELCPMENRPRPKDAIPLENDEPFTPFYDHLNHLHIEHGQVMAIHARGEEEPMREFLQNCLAYEEAILAATPRDVTRLPLIDAMNIVLRAAGVKSKAQAPA